jgi:RNase H-fold protein (predicted Holliday junction resolvase)
MTAWRQQASAFFPILLWNERNTSWAVDQERHAIYKTSQKNSRITSHSLCARMILEEVLNCIQIL